MIKIQILKRLLHTKLNFRDASVLLVLPQALLKKDMIRDQPATINQVEKVQSLLSQDLSFIHTSLDERA